MFFVGLNEGEEFNPRVKRLWLDGWLFFHSLSLSLYFNSPGLSYGLKKRGANIARKEKRKRNESRTNRWLRMNEWCTEREFLSSKTSSWERGRERERSVERWEIHRTGNTTIATNGRRERTVLPRGSRLSDAIMRGASCAMFYRFSLWYLYHWSTHSYQNLHTHSLSLVCINDGIKNLSVAESVFSSSNERVSDDDS